MGGAGFCGKGQRMDRGKGQTIEGVNTNWFVLDRGVVITTPRNDIDSGDCE